MYYTYASVCFRLYTADTADEILVSCSKLTNHCVIHRKNSPHAANQKAKYIREHWYSNKQDRQLETPIDFVKIGLKLTKPVGLEPRPVGNFHIFRKVPYHKATETEVL